MFDEFFKAAIAKPAAYPPATISEGAVKRIDELLQQGARAKAELQVRREHEKMRQDLDDYRNTVAGCAVEAAPGPAPRLEPYYGEVKDQMRKSGMNEKAAEKAVRKMLLHDAALVITDRNVQALVHAVLSLI